MIKRLLTIALLHTVYLQKANSTCLDYSSALDRVICRSSQTKIADLQVDMRKAEAWQASLYPNPEFSFEVGSNFWDNDHIEIGMGLAQLIPTAGKLEKAHSLAQTQVDAAYWKKELVYLDQELQFAEIFIQTAVIQEKLALLKQRCRNAAEGYECSQAKMSSGQISMLSCRKSEAVLKGCQLAMNAALLKMESLKKALALFWDCPQPDFDTVFFPLFDLAPVPPLCVLESYADAAPDLELLRAGWYSASAATSLERSRRVPDVIIGADVWMNTRCSEAGFDASVSFPIPIFNCNQGNIARSLLQEWESIYLIEHMEVGLHAKLAALWEELTAAYQDACRFRDLMNTLGQECLVQAEAKHQEGKEDCLQFLEEEKIMLDMREQWIDAAAAYHSKKAQMKRLLGHNIE
jgi:cobalt-zinc-cadmium efflux system outer membrane protein